MGDEEHVLHGPRDDKPLPDVPLGQYLLQRLRLHGDKVAQIHPDLGVTYTCSELVQRAVSVAEELEARGVMQGDVLVVIITVTPDFAPILLGGLLVGAVIAPLSPAFDKRDLKAMLTLYQPKMIFSYPSTVAIVEEIIPHLDSHPELVQFQDEASWGKFLKRKPNPDYRGADIPDFLDQTAFIMTSSGTTGLSKGVLVTQRSVMAQLLTSADSTVAFVRDDDMVLQLSPVFWISGLFPQMFPMVCGSALVVLSTFTGEKILKTVHEHKVTMMFVSPNLAAMLSRTPCVSQYDLSGVRNLMCSGAALSTEQHTAAQTALHATIHQWFAMTETLLVLGTLPGDKVKPGSSGKLQRNTMAKVLDIISGRPLGPMERGELCVIGPGITKGYYRNPQATAETIDEHGWLHTGDVAYYDEDGYFYVVDRLKDLIKYKGQHVAPVEIECFLLEHPAVKEVAVVGVKHELDQERPLAVIVRTPGVSVTEQELVDLVASNMAEHKWLRAGVLFVDSLPKTTTGKVQRRVLRDQVNQGMK